MNFTKQKQKQTNTCIVSFAQNGWQIATWSVGPPILV